MINSMVYKDYTASMVFDTEDKIIVGRVLDIDDIISFHGETIPEFESNFHAAIEDYLAASQELGSSPEKPQPAQPGAMGSAMPPCGQTHAASNQAKLEP
jgi:predicted HicB family RNase H-like nuclease